MYALFFTFVTDYKGQMLLKSIKIWQESPDSPFLCTSAEV